MDAQRTLRRAISCVGIGLHSGNKVQLSLKPAPADYGIRFRRTDLGDHEVRASVQHLAGINLATALSCNQVSVETVERDDVTVLRLHVAPDDVGKVIGRQGRLARALRTVVRASGARDGRRVVLEIAD